MVGVQCNLECFYSNCVELLCLQRPLVFFFILKFILYFRSEKNEILVAPGTGCNNQNNTVPTFEIVFKFLIIFFIFFSRVDVIYQKKKDFLYKKSSIIFV